MEQQDILNKEVGNKDLPRLEAKEVEVHGIRVDEKEIKGKKEPGKLVVVICKHPDQENTIELTKIKVLREDKARVIGLWYQEDSDGKIQKGSSCHKLLELGDVDKLGELVGKKIPTVKQSENSSYLCFKAY